MNTTAMGQNRVLHATPVLMPATWSSNKDGTKTIHYGLPARLVS
jgi:hypothetical protein